MDKYNFNNQDLEDKQFTEDNLIKITLEFLRKMKSISLISQNSCFCITDNNLVVLKCFINENTHKDIFSLLPRVGKRLEDNLYNVKYIQTVASKHSSVTINTVSNNELKQINIESILCPIKYKNKIIGYLNIITLNTHKDILLAFVESFSLIIEKELEEAFIKKEINNYLKLINAESQYKTLKGIFSFREQLVSDYMLMGYSNIQIAEEMKISESTVKTYLKRIYEKCGTNNRINTAIVIICNNIMSKL